MDTNKLRVDKESFSVCRTIPDTACEQSVERDFVLPDYYPDIFRVLKCFIIPKITAHTISGTKLTFEMTVLARVLYLTENESRIYSIEQKMNYTKTCEISEECSKPMISITPRCDYMNCRVVNQRRLDLRGAVTATIHITGESMQEIVTGAEGCGIQLKKEEVTYPAKRLTASKRITVIEELELSASKPPMKYMLRSDCAILSHEQKIIAGKLITKGEAEISVLYTCITEEGTDGIESMKFSVPFSQIIDVEGIDETFETQTDITAVGCDIMAKGESSTAMECELILIVSCTAEKFKTCSIVTDAYSTMCECEQQSGDYRLSAASVPVSRNISASTKITSQGQGMKCVYSANAECCSVTTRTDEEKKCFTVSGNVCYSMLACGEDGLPIYLEAETPFEQEIEMPEANGCELSFEPKATVTACSYYLSDTSTAELKAELNLSGCIRKQYAKNMLTGLQCCTDKPKARKDGYALKLCFCGENEDIWKIAKKYSTSVSAIMEENELDENAPSERGMLLIPLTD